MRASLGPEPRASRASVDSRLCGTSAALAGVVAVVWSSGTSVPWTPFHAGALGAPPPVSSHLWL